MSDRRNRDKGRKIAYKKQHPRWLCGCWLCEVGSIKKAWLRERELRSALDPLDPRQEGPANTPL